MLATEFRRAATSQGGLVVNHHIYVSLNQPTIDQIIPGSAYIHRRRPSQRKTIVFTALSHT